MDTIKSAAELIGARIGRGIAHGYIYNGFTGPWTGFGAEGSRQLLRAGIKPGSDEWLVAERAAAKAYAWAIR